jgi:hypothetical protein
LWLRKKYAAAKMARQDSKNILSRLLHQHNPFAGDGQNYTLNYFKIQWQNQVSHLKKMTDEDTERRAKLTKLLEKEESLKKFGYIKSP